MKVIVVSHVKQKERNTTKVVPEQVKQRLSN